MNSPSPNPAALILVVVVAGVLMALLWVVRRRAVESSLAGDPFPLHDAVREGDEEGVAHLLAAGADPNGVDAAGMTPLLHAVQRGDARIAGLLCDAGVDVNARAAALRLAEDDPALREVAAVLRRHGAAER